MNETLLNVIKKSERARELIFETRERKASLEERQTTVSEANSVANNNRGIIGAFMIDIRERMLSQQEADLAALPGDFERVSDGDDPAEEKQ